MVQMCLSFYEVANNDMSLFWSSLSMDEPKGLCWEQWYINVRVAKRPTAPSNTSHHSESDDDPGGD